MPETLGKGVVDLTVDDSGIDPGLAAAEQKTISWGQRLASGLTSTITLALTGAVTAGVTALSGLGAAGLSSFMSFERQMNEVFTLLPNASQQAMDSMTSQVKDFAREFGVLPQNVVPALYEALSSGVPPDNVFDFLAVAQKAAIGGATDVKTTVDGLTSVVNAYGADILNASSASDIMFKAVAFGKTTFQELSGSLYNVNPVAASLGISFKDVAASIAAMTLQGVPTAQTTTMLRQLFLELSQEGTNVSEIFQQISGQSFRNFIASGGDVQGALQLLEQYAQSTGVGINDLFGSVEAGGAALSLTGRGAGMFAEALDQIGNSSGATEAAFQRMDQGLSRSIDYIKASLSTLVIDIGNKLAPAFEQFASWIMANMPQIEDTVLRIFSGIGAGIQAVGPYLLEFLSIASNVFSTFIDLSSQAAEWGMNIARQIGEGILGGSGWISDALSYIGDMISYWLEPHSPPKLLPNIDRWGKDTAQIWMDSWLDAKLPADDLLSELEGELKKIEDAQQALNEQKREKELLDLINSTGGDDSIREAAKLELAALKLRQKIRAEKEKQTSNDGKGPVKSGPKGGGGGGGKSPMDEAAKKAEAAAKAQWEYNFSIASTADRLGMLKEKQSQYTTSDAEYWRIQGQINQEEQKRQRELETLAEKQLEYQRSLMTTEERIASLKDEQSKYSEGSAEWIDLQNRINAAEKDHQRELEAGQKARDDVAKAERDYAYATADTAGKLDILRDELSKTNEGSVDYWRIKTQISQLEAQQQKELEGSAKALGGVGSAASGAGKGLKGLGGALPGIGAGFKGIADEARGAQKPVDDSKQSADELRQKYEDLKDRQGEVADGMGGMSAPSDAVRQAFASIQPVADAVRGAFLGIATVFTVLKLIPLFQGLAMAVGALASPLGLLVGGAALLGAAWATNFGGIQEKTQQVITAVQGVIQPAFALISGWFQTHGAEIVLFFTGAWNQFEGIVSRVLGAVSTIVTTVLGSIRDFLSTHGTEIQGLMTTVWETIQSVISTAIEVINTVIIPKLQTVVDFITRHKDEITSIITILWDGVKGLIEGAMTAIQGIMQVITGLIRGDWETVWNGIQSFVQGIWNGINSIIDTGVRLVQTVLSTVWGEIKTTLEEKWNGFKTFIGDSINGAKKALDDTLGPIKTALSDAWRDITTGVTTTWDGVKSTILGAVEGALRGLKSPINGMITILNGLIDGVNAVSNALGQGNVINPIPYLAKGTTGWKGGPAFASEPWLGLEAMRTPQGKWALLPPGISNIPRGAEVFSAKETAAMAARGTPLGTSGGRTASAPTTIVNLTVNIDARGAVNPAEVAAQATAAAKKVLNDVTIKAALRQAAQS